MTSTVGGQRRDVDPGAGLARPQPGVLEGDVLDRLVEPRLVLGAAGDGGQELVVLDHLEVLVADRVAVARHEMALIRVAVAGQHRRIAAGRLAVVVDQIYLELVHRLEVPAQGALGAVDVERHLRLGPDDRPRRLERAARAVGEGHHRRRVVLVGDGSGGIAGLAAVVVRAAGVRQRAVLDERLHRARHAADRSDEHRRQVDRVAQDVGRHAVAGLVDQEPPRQQAHRVGAVHREEATPVVGDLTQPSRLDQVLGVQHERRPAVVVTRRR